MDYSLIMNGFFPRLYFKSNGLSRFSQVFYTSIHLYDPEVAYFVTILMILSLLSYTISLSNNDQKGYILIVTAINVV